MSTKNKAQKAGPAQGEKDAGDPNVTTELSAPTTGDPAPKRRWTAGRIIKAAIWAIILAYGAVGAAAIIIASAKLCPSSGDGLLAHACAQIGHDEYDSSPLPHFVFDPTLVLRTFLAILISTIFLIRILAKCRTGRRIMEIFVLANGATSILLLAILKTECSFFSQNTEWRLYVHAAFALTALATYFVHLAAKRRPDQHQRIQESAIRIIVILFFVLLIAMTFLQPTLTGKPVLYLYPEKPTDVTVTLNYHGKIVADLPAYDPAIKGWKVKAYPDGLVVDPRDGREYSYVFWEGMPDRPTDWDLSTGFVVKGSDAREFLHEKLSAMGLTPKEYNEFIVYWYPKLQENAYNLVHFAGKEYEDLAPMEIVPKPDALLRVFMVFKPISGPVDVTPQTFKPFVRRGFTAVEWGGTELPR